MLAILQTPDRETVPAWRSEQERALREFGADDIGVMDDVAVARLVSHYERLTSHILNQMPGRAD